MGDTLHAVKHYQRVLERSAHDQKRMLRCIEKLYQLPVTVQLLQDTGVGRTVNALRKGEGEVANAARTVIAKWKQMVADEEEELENQQAERNENRHSSPPPPEDDRTYERNVSKKYEKNISSHSKFRNGSEDDRNEERQKMRIQEREYEEKERQRTYNREKEYERAKSSRYDSPDNDDDSDEQNDRNDVEDYEAASSEAEESDVASDRVQNEEYKNDSDEESTPDVPSFEKSSSRESSKRVDAHDSSYERRSRDCEKSDRHKSKHKSGSHNSSSVKSSSRDDTSSSKLKDVPKESNDRSRERSSTSHGNNSSRDESEKYVKRSNSEKKDKYDSKTDKDSKSHKENFSKEHCKPEKTSHSDSKNKHHSSNKESHSHKNKESKHHSHKNKHSDIEKHDHDKVKKTEKHKSHSEKSNSESHKDENAKEKHRSKHSSSKNDNTHNSKSKSLSKDNIGKSESKSEHKHKHKDSSSDQGSDAKKRKIVDYDDGIDGGSGASFAEALGMISPMSGASSKKKAKLTSDSVESPKETSPSTSGYNKNNANNDTPSLLKDPSKLSPLPPLTVSVSALPDISPNYVPRPAPRLIDYPHLPISEEEALSVVMNSKNQRTKVFSGNKTSHGYIPSLSDLCIFILQENINSLEYTGGVPYEILKPVIDKATPEQLFMLEHYNPYLIEDTDALWEGHCNKRFRNKHRQEMESWRDMYMRCYDEQEAKLKSLTANIKLSQDKSQPVRQTKMAYVDSVVKPPRNIARKQAIHGTARKPVASPAARVASLANNTVFNGAATSAVGTSSSIQPVRIPGGFIKPKKAPLMQKALQLIKGRFKR